MMQRRRLILDGLEPGDRYRFASALFNRFRDALEVRFPAVDGYQVVWEDAQSVFRISRGNFWGLAVTLVSKDAALKVWDLQVEPCFPVVHRFTEPILRSFGRSPTASWFSSQIFAHLVLVPMLALLPFLVVYRLALLILGSDARGAAGQFDLLWPEMQASWGGPIPQLRKRSPGLIYGLAFLATAAAATGCIWLAETSKCGVTLTTALYFVGFILVLLSLILLIGSALIALGFEIGR